MPAVLTPNEERVLGFVKQATPKGRPVAAWFIRDRLWHNGRSHGLSYDQVNRILTSLVKKGRLVKPKRGWYLPA